MKVTKPASESLWGMEHDEYLQSDIHDVIEYWLDSQHPTPIDQLPKVITVHEYSRRVPDEDGSRQLEDLLEQLDEEYADPNTSDFTKPTETMKEAARVFAAAVLAEYEVWTCEPTGHTETIDVMAWVRENAPEWLEPSS
ncbi:MAG: hypothetical protein GTO41_27910 [Burkholderiales bacterium]|nr:hypothetical protein [Burkholderiales bacterium]